jgi:hypothetical protein
VHNRQARPSNMLASLLTASCAAVHTEATPIKRSAIHCQHVHPSVAMLPARFDSVCEVRSGDLHQYRAAVTSKPSCPPATTCGACAGTRNPLHACTPKGLKATTHGLTPSASCGSEEFQRQHNAAHFDKSQRRRAAQHEQGCARCRIPFQHVGNGLTSSNAWLGPRSTAWTFAAVGLGCTLNWGSLPWQLEHECTCLRT